MTTFTRQCAPGRIAVLLLLMTLFAGWLAVNSAQAADGIRANLFTQAVLPATARVGAPLYTSRFQPARVDIGQLDALGTNESIGFNLFSDVYLTGSVETITQRTSVSYSITGHLIEDPAGTFILVVEDDVVAATIRTADPPRVFQLRYAGDGIHLICETDPLQYPPCKGSIPVPGGAEDNGLGNLDVTPPLSPDERSAGAACTRLQPVFDILVVYTSLARSRAGGTNAINALCQLAIEESNQAYNQSQIDARMRLVYRGEVSYDETGGYSHHLDWVSGNSTIHSLRDTYAADFVALLVDDSSYCGLGQCYDGSYTTTAWHCATGYYSFSHEIGHNQGCDHDRENAGASSCSYHSYSYGWRFVGNSGTEWRTIMAYSPGTRIQYFSNPYVFYDGQQTGVAIGETNQSYNAATINDRRDVGEAKRMTRLDIWVDFYYPGPIAVGHFDYPYQTIASGAAAIITGVGASELPTLWIKAGSTAETPVIDKKMVLRPCGGPAIIGRAAAN